MSFESLSMTSKLQEKILPSKISLEWKKVRVFKKEK